MTQTAKTICRRELTLVPGRRYQASRPIAKRDGMLFPIFIRDITDSWHETHETVEVLEGFTYDEANEFLAEFNNGRTSFDGRVW